MKIQRKDKNEDHAGNDQPNSRSQSRRPTTKSGVQVSAKVRNVQLYSPPITFIPHNPARPELIQNAEDPFRAGAQKTLHKEQRHTKTKKKRSSTAASSWTLRGRGRNTIELWSRSPVMFTSVECELFTLFGASAQRLLPESTSESHYDVCGVRSDDGQLVWCAVGVGCVCAVVSCCAVWVGCVVVVVSVSALMCVYIHTTCACISSRS